MRFCYEYLMIPLVYLFVFVYLPNLLASKQASKYTYKHITTENKGEKRKGLFI